MNIKFVESFILLARMGNVRRVADHLNTTPGAISMRLQSLEESLGIQLFDREKKSLRLSAEGVRLMPYAESLVQALRKFESAANADDMGLGRVRLGINETVVHTVLPELIKTIAASFPRLEVDLTVDLTSHLADQLLQRDTDLIIRVVGENDDPSAVSRHLMEIPMQWIARRGLISARDPLRRVLGTQILTVMRGSIPYIDAVRMVQQLCDQQGLAASDLRITGSPSMAGLVALAREGIGVAIMPAVLVREHIERGELVELARLPPPPPFRIATCHLRNAPAVVSQVSELIHRTCKAYCRRQGSTWVKYLG
ncbi:LysR family transcriptional regulator [Variovorax sp. CY25R-8]|uniref:LysR family transcriptional regulator n=1 Tax=Variovorax sp. CY25R-8 TaxID=2855501 RepID=UPI0021BB8094|nr:LysR family transcriptional regulator [Variovorax sp. CY25R-8]MCT8179224.1 LysR family transcriptional regulator [Variovorax sp. CY25R-8]